VPEPDQSAEDLLAIVENVHGLNNQPVHLMGQSLGGRALTKPVIARQRPSTSLTLSGSIGGMFSADTRQSLQAFIDSMRASAGQRTAVGRSAALAPGFGERVRPDGMLFQLLGLVPGPGVSAVERLLDSTVKPEALAATGTPVLFIVGEHDTIFAPDRVAAVVRSIRGAQLEVITDAGHSPSFERPDEFNSALTRILRKVDSHRKP